jgi:hypothetical protein
MAEFTEGLPVVSDRLGLRIAPLPGARRLGLAVTGARQPSASLSRGTRPSGSPAAVRNWPANRAGLEGQALAIAVMVLWLGTAVAGLTLLKAGGAARRATTSEPATTNVLADSLAVTPAGAPVAARRSTAVPLTPDGRPPPGPHIRVETPAGEHPLLEFSHPTLAVTGIACWMMYAFVHYRPLAWIAFAILAVTLVLGLGWFIRNRQEASRQAGPAAGGTAWSFPPRLVWLHGCVAVCTLALTVLTALIASRS